MSFVYETIEMPKGLLAINADPDPAVIYLTGVAGGTGKPHPSASVTAVQGLNEPYRKPVGIECRRAFREITEFR
jgi:hypothetical protein